MIVKKLRNYTHTHDLTVINASTSGNTDHQLTDGTQCMHRCLHELRMLLCATCNYGSFGLSSLPECTYIYLNVYRTDQIRKIESKYCTWVSVLPAISALPFGPAYHLFCGARSRHVQWLIFDYFFVPSLETHALTISRVSNRLILNLLTSAFTSVRYTILKQKPKPSTG